MMNARKKEMMPVNGQVAVMETTAELLPLLRDFCPLYSTVRPEEMTACMYAMQRGGRLPEIIANRDPAWIRLTAETALDTEVVADSFICLTPEEQIAYPCAGLSDFTLATLSGIMMENIDTEHVDAMTLAMNDLLLAALDSETASPLIDYEWIYQDMVQYHVVDRRGIEPVWTLKRSAAHDLKLCGGERIPRILAHMAEVCMELDDFAEGFRLYAALLRYDPLHLDTIHALAMDLAYARCFNAAIIVGEHLLALWSKSNKRHLPCAEIAAEIQMWKSSLPKKEGKVLSPVVFTSIHDILFSSAPGHLNVKRLVQEAIPEIDEIPVKRPLL